MAASVLNFQFPPYQRLQLVSSNTVNFPKTTTTTTTYKCFPKSSPPNMFRLQPLPAIPKQGLQGVVSGVLDLIQASPPTWQSSFFSNLLIFIVGSPILVSGLSLSGIGAAFLLGSLTWRAYGASGFLLVAMYFVIGTAATKLKMTQKEAQGVAEKRKGRRGPGSVIGSSAAGCICAFLSIYGIGGAAFSGLWKLGFVASFCTKLSDTVSSEIGKAYGKTTYLVTTFKVVPRGTEGAVSVEGTVAGLLASVLLASIGCVMGEINVPEAVICVAASQIANLGESVIGAALQDKEGFQWVGNFCNNELFEWFGSIFFSLVASLTFVPFILRPLPFFTHLMKNTIQLPHQCFLTHQLNNDVVNVINISIGSVLAVLLQQLMIRNWHH